MKRNLHPINVTKILKMLCIFFSEKMTLIGLAKNKEELFFAGDAEPITLAWNGESLKLIRRIRDEVHRFAITFHRAQRSKSAIRNELLTIPGIGSHTAESLMKTFKSVKKISKLSLLQLEHEIGPVRAGIIYDYFHKESKNN